MVVEVDVVGLDDVEEVDVGFEVVLDLLVVVDLLVVLVVVGPEDEPPQVKSGGPGMGYEV